jgi:hypothetical protein
MAFWVNLFHDQLKASPMLKAGAGWPPGAPPYAGCGG